MEVGGCATGQSTRRRETVGTAARAQEGRLERSRSIFSVAKLEIWVERLILGFGVTVVSEDCVLADMEDPCLSVVDSSGRFDPDALGVATGVARAATNAADFFFDVLRATDNGLTMALTRLLLEVIQRVGSEVKILEDLTI